MKRQLVLISVAFVEILQDLVRAWRECLVDVEKLEKGILDVRLETTRMNHQRTYEFFFGIKFQVFVNEFAHPIYVLQVVHCPLSLFHDRCITSCV